MQWEASYFKPKDGQTDRHDKANSRVWQICACAKRTKSTAKLNLDKKLVHRSESRQWKCI